MPAVVASSRSPTWHPFLSDRPHLQRLPTARPDPYAHEIREDHDRRTPRLMREGRRGQILRRKSILTPTHRAGHGNLIAVGAVPPHVVAILWAQTRTSGVLVTRTAELSLRSVSLYASCMPPLVLRRKAVNRTGVKVADVPAAPPSQNRRLPRTAPSGEAARQG